MKGSESYNMAVLTMEELKIEEVLKNKNIAPEAIVFQIDIKSVINSFKSGMESIIDRFPLIDMSKGLIEKFVKTYMTIWLVNGDIEGSRHLAALTFEEVYSGIFREEIKELFVPDEILYINMFC